MENGCGKNVYYCVPLGFDAVGIAIINILEDEAIKKRSWE